MKMKIVTTISIFLLLQISISQAQNDQIIIADEEFIFDIAEELMNDGDYKSAIVYYSGLIEIDSLNKKTLLYRGIAQFEIGKYDEALSDLNRAIKIDSSDYELYYNRGVIYSHAKDNKLAIMDLTKSITLKPDSPWGYYTRGLIQFNETNYKQALSDFSSAIKLNSNNLDFHTEYVKALFQLNRDTIQAIEEYTKVINLFPYDYEPYYSRGYVYTIIGQYEKAIKDFDEAKKITEYYDIYAQKGMCHYYLKNFDLALKNFNQSLKLKPSYAALYYYKGVIYMNQGKKKKACIEFEKAKNLASDWNEDKLKDMSTCR